MTTVKQTKKKVIIKATPQPLRILQGYIKKEYYNIWLEEYFYSIVNRIKLWKAIRLANSLKKSYNREYYIIDGGRKGLAVFNNAERKMLVREKFLGKNAGHLEIMSICLYYTGWERAVKKDKEQREYEKLKFYFDKQKQKKEA